jgi:hypothetical protein
MARFLVANVFQIVGRGLGVTGHIVDGSLAIGMVLRQEHGPTKMEWRVIDIASVYSTTDEANLGLFLENAPELEELRRLLPPGSTLVGDDPVFPTERPASRLIDDLRTTLERVNTTSLPDNRYLMWPIPVKWMTTLGH